MLQRVLSVLLVAAVAACTTLGKTEVRVETGNQPSGYLSRPMTLTTSSDEAIQEVAQGICDNVRTGSDAQVSFVGKIPNPNPLGVGDWGRYHFDCIAPAAPAARATAARANPALPLTAPAVSMAAAPAAPPAATSAGVAAGSIRMPASADPAHLRQCLQQQGLYHVCLGNCLLDPAAVPGTLAAPCQQQCAPKLTAACN